MARRKKEEPIIDEIKVEATPVVEEVESTISLSTLFDSLVEEEKPKKKKRAPIAKVNTPALNVRPDASMNNKPVKLLHEGDKVTVVKDLGEWLQIEEGFVMSKYITIK